MTLWEALLVNVAVAFLAISIGWSASRIVRAATKSTRAKDKKKLETMKN